MRDGSIKTIIVKDHSRLGLNKLVVGTLLEEDFERNGVRYIAIMDNIDSDKGLSDLVPIQDLFNEWHAENTSQKVRSVMQSEAAWESSRGENQDGVTPLYCGKSRSGAVF